MDNPVPSTNPVQIPESSDIKGNKRERGWIKEGFILALCTFTGYLVAYAYEDGFCHHFWIPSSFIEIDVVTILVSVIYTFVIVFMLAIGMAMYYEGAHDDVMRISKALRTRLLFTLFSIISSIILLALPVQPVLLRFIFPALLTIMVLFLWFYPLVKYGGSYIERLKRADEEASKQKHPELKIINLVKAHNAQYPFAFVVLILCLIMIAYLAGNGAATNQRSFLVIPAAEGFPELVVLKVYNQKLVCATFNRTTREVNHVFTFRDLVPSSKTPEMMRLEEIGPLWSKPSL